MDALSLAPGALGRTVLAVVALFFAATCGVIGPIGDTTRTVTVRNALAQPIELYTFQRDARYQIHLAAGQSISQGWMFPVTADDRRVRRIEADDARGTMVFCLDVTYEELVKRKWTIEIASGHEACS